MDETLHAHWQQLKSFTERLEDIIEKKPGSPPINMAYELRMLLSDMQRATDVAKEEYEAF